MELKKNEQTRCYECSANQLYQWFMEENLTLGNVGNCKLIEISDYSITIEIDDFSNLLTTGQKVDGCEVYGFSVETIKKENGVYQLMIMYIMNGDAQELHNDNKK